MIHSYLPVLILLIIATLVPIGLIIVSHLLGPTVKGGIKEEPYECGVPAVGSPKQFPVKFHRIAIFFLLLDVEAALLFPWAVVFKHKLSTWGGTFLAIEFVVFLLILVSYPGGAGISLGDNFQ